MQSQTGEARRGGHNPRGAGLRAIALGDPDVESTDAHFDVRSGLTDGNDMEAVYMLDQGKQKRVAAIGDVVMSPGNLRGVVIGVKGTVAQSSKPLEKSCEIRRLVANCKAFRKRVL